MCVKPADILALSGLVFTAGKEPLNGKVNLALDSDFVIISPGYLPAIPVHKATAVFGTSCADHL
jgi:hypothetical protein